LWFGRFREKRAREEKIEERKKGKIKMSRLLNILSQILLSSGQVVNLIYPILGERQKVYTGVGLGVLQLTVSAIANSYNPDGTLASVPYVPPTKINVNKDVDE
jgi:hypothetical protein